MNLQNLAKKAGNQIVTNYISLDDLKDFFLVGNAKNHDLDLLIESFVAYGFRDPIGFDPKLNDGKGGIIEGNGRIESLLKMRSENYDPPRGITKDWKIPVIFGVEAKSEAEAIAFSIEHNWSVTWGSDVEIDSILSMFDQNSLAEQINHLKIEDSLPLSFEGNFDEIIECLNLEQNKNPFGGYESEEETEAYDPENLEIRVKEGDVWQLGNHRLACIDSLDEKLVKKFISSCDREVSMIWSDPPYGISIQEKDGRVGGAKGLGRIPGAKKYPKIYGDETPNCAMIALNMYLDLYPQAVQIWWGANHYITPASSCWIVWDKKCDQPGTDGLQFADAELAWTNQKTAVRVFRHLWMGGWKQSEISQARMHPTQKPIALFDWCWQKYGQGNFVYDPFLGSGISIIGAEKLEEDVICYGSEKSDHYCTVILNRFATEFDIEAKLITNLLD